MSRLILRHFQTDGLEIIVDLGFIPDLVRVWLDEGTRPDVLTWFRRMVDDESSIYGFLSQGSDGIVTRATTAGTGIVAYDTTQQGVLIESPVGGKVFASVTNFAIATNYATGERTASAIGTIVRPIVHNGFVYELTTDQSTGDGEPTWPTIPGETVQDSGNNVWTCRLEEVTVIGAKGIVIGATVTQNDDDNQIYVEAFKADRDPADLDVLTVPAGIPA